MWDVVQRTLIVTDVSGQPIVPNFKGQEPGQEIPHILCNLKFHYRVYKSLQLVPIPIQIHPFPAPSSDLTPILNSYPFTVHVVTFTLIKTNTCTHFITFIYTLKHQKIVKNVL
jgi:hypothetical protein